MIKNILNIYKPLGATPLEAINAFKNKFPEYKDIKMGYAGRLDPLAEGVLLVLTGEELKKQKQYWQLNKQYKAKILFGFETDSYDLLGIPEIGKIPAEKFLTKDSLVKTLTSFKGEYTFPLPPFSSKKIKGKPLFWWAREGKLNEIEVPTKTSTILSIDLESQNYIEKDELLKDIKKKIALVKGDFRQNKILELWQVAIDKQKADKMPVIDISVECSSGTYIRSLTKDIGLSLKSSAVLMHLTRTRVGEYEFKDSVKIS